jgi:hypothetical protein
VIVWRPTDSIKPWPHDAGRETAMKKISVAAATMAILSACAAGPDSTAGVGSSAAALTDSQCIYFESNGTDTICHATGSAKHPFVLVKISEAGCVDGHLGHPNDFIDLGGGNCNQAACLPTGAPCDATLGCCSGACSNATCACSAAGADCATASDCCAGTCFQDSCCTPATACPAGDNCGTISDGCGGTLDCGTCPGSQTCTNNQCNGSICALYGQECRSNADCCNDVPCNSVTGACSASDVGCTCHVIIQ